MHTHLPTFLTWSKGKILSQLTLEMEMIGELCDASYLRYTTSFSVSLNFMLLGFFLQGKSLRMNCNPKYHLNKKDEPHSNFLH